MKSKLSILFLSAVFVTACGSGDDQGVNSDANGKTGNKTFSKSSDVSYSTVTELSSNINEFGAINSGVEISSNGLELYFHSNRAGVMDLYVATRATKTDSWDFAQNISAINSISKDRSPTISNDGLVLIFSSNRGSADGSSDLYQSTRFSDIDPWESPILLSGNINTAFNESGPSLSADGLSLYFDSNSSGNIDIYVATRFSVSDPWDSLVNISEINTLENEVEPEISSDGLTLYFNSTPVGGDSFQDIWRSTRSTVDSAWSTPTLIPAPVNTEVGEFAFSLSDDWKTLYFTSDINAGNRNIWMATP